MRIAFLPLGGGGEENAIAEWLRAQTDLDVAIIDARELAACAADVVWLHGVDAEIATLPVPANPISFLLTGTAARLPQMWGWESVPPNDITNRIWRDADDDLFLFHDFTEAPRVRGHAGFREHPLFEGLYGGVYTWWPQEGERFCTVTYNAGGWPAAGQVVAVERAHPHVNATRATIWEYDRPNGRVVLCVGAYLPFASPDPILRPCLDRLMRNTFAYCGGSAAHAARCYWPRPGSATVRHDPSLSLPRIALRAEAVEELPGLLALSAVPERDAAVTLAGRRVFAAGNEVEGITEVWTHPIRIVKNLEIKTGVGPAPARSFRVTPLFCERTLADGVVERVLVADELPVVAWNWRVQQPCTLSAEWLVDLRFMWPYPAGVLGTLRWNVDQHALLVAADDARDVARFSASKPVVWVVEAEPGEAPAIRVRMEVQLTTNEVFNLTASGTQADHMPTDVRRLSSGNAGRWHKRSSQLLRVSASDPRLEIALQWASHRLDRAVVETPGVGRSLVAGYAGSKPGWGDGRPGYAWFFGRDAAWTAFALLAIGDFQPVRDVIAFLGDKQDPRGKVLHECTTSGSVHYDAADSTPLYLLLVSRYLAASGDLHFVRSRWPQVWAALEYCRSTDTGIVTFYNAGIWVAALRELAITAETIGERTVAEGLRAEATRARHALEHTQTDTHAVPLLLDSVPIGRMSNWLDLVAGEDFTVPLYTGWTAWAEYRAGRTASAFRHLWQNLLLCFEREKGAWDEVLHGTELRSVGVCQDQACSTALTVAPFVYGLLGFEPDAAKQRAALMPALPDQWQQLDVENLRVGENTISLRCERDGAVHRFRLLPGTGSVPLRIIFEPRIHGPVRQVRIDGVTATLDLRQFGDRTICPLQIVLDHDREIAIETAEGFSGAES